MHQSPIFKIPNMSFDIICENKSLTKISEFTAVKVASKQTFFMPNLTEHEIYHAHKC